MHKMKASLPGLYASQPTVKIQRSEVGGPTAVGEEWQCEIEHAQNEGFPPRLVMLLAYPSTYSQDPALLAAV